MLWFLLLEIVEWTPLDSEANDITDGQNRERVPYDFCPKEGNDWCCALVPRPRNSFSGTAVLHNLPGRDQMSTSTPVDRFLRIPIRKICANHQAINILAGLRRAPNRIFPNFLKNYDKAHKSKPKVWIIIRKGRPISNSYSRKNNWTNCRRNSQSPAWRKAIRSLSLLKGGGIGVWV